MFEYIYWNDQYDIVSNFFFLQNYTFLTRYMYSCKYYLRIN